MRRFGLGFSIVILTLVVMLFSVGCSQQDDPTAFDQGVEALKKRNVTEAKKQFAQVELENEEKADSYLEVIEAAELIETSLEEEDDLVAADTYRDIKKHEYLSQVIFMFSDELNYLKNIIAEQEHTTALIDALYVLYDPETLDQTAADFYSVKTEEVLSRKYLTPEQVELLEQFRDTVKKAAPISEQDDVSGDESTDQKKASDEADEDTQETTDQKKEQKEGSEAQQNAEENNKQNEKQNENDGQLTKEEAKKVLVTYLSEEDPELESMLSGDNFYLNYDHDDLEGNYVFQLFEIVSDGEAGHTATYGWYGVDKETGDVTDKMAN